MGWTSTHKYARSTRPNHIVAHSWASIIARLRFRKKKWLLTSMGGHIPCPPLFFKFWETLKEPICLARRKLPPLLLKFAVWFTKPWIGRNFFLGLQNFPNIQIFDYRIARGP